MSIFEVGRRRVALLLFVMSIGLLMGSQAFAAGTIEVTGEGEVKVVADEVILTLSVVTRDLELSKGLNENNARVKRIFDVLTSQGVEAKKIQTHHMQCSPQYEEYQSQPATFLGYLVSKHIVVTLNDLSKFEGILSRVIVSGATHVQGIQFRTTQLRKHRDTARDMAMKHAKEKAEALAAAVGQKIGRATAIKEALVDRWGPAPQAQPSYPQAARVAYEQDPIMGESIAPGEIGVTAKVIVTFDLQ
ncbi:MAG: SIMPL domain-containing protein [Thermodesulfobacteriota bacterium]